MQSKDALTCLANLVVALGSEMEEYIADLTPAMFSGGLSPSLIDTLVVISQVSINNYMASSMGCALWFGLGLGCWLCCFTLCMPRRIE